MKIPVLKNRSLEEVHWLDVHSELIMLTIDSGDIALVTEDGMFTLPSTIDEWERVLQPLGYEKSDRNCIVKMDKITEVDGERRLVFFGEASQASSIFATVSKSRWRTIVDFFKRRKS